MSTSIQHSPRHSGALRTIATRTLTFALALTVATVACGVAATDSTAAAAAADPCPVSAKLVPSCGVLLGVSTEKVGTQTWDQSVTEHEVEIGREVDILHNYHLWNTAFPDAAEAARVADGQKLLVSWIGNRQDGSRVSWASIASGAEDSVIDAEARNIAAAGVPVFVNFQNEPESSIGLSGTAAEYVAAWRHIHDRFAAVGTTNAVWTLIFMGVMSDNKQAQVKALYPGDAYVDWIAWDPYNWGDCRDESWKSFSGTVKPFYDWLTANGMGSKPFMLGEYGTVEDPSNTSAKADWFTGAGTSLANGEFPNLKAVSYFDHPAPPASCDWRLATSAASAASYKSFALKLGVGTTTPVTKPAAPTAVTASAASSSAVISWVAPSNTGGAAITDYRVRVTPGGGTLVVAGPSPITRAAVAGLTPGTSYTFVVSATNSAGTSLASTASASVIPKAKSASSPATTQSGWQLNGTTALVNGGLQLTDATTKFSAGSAFWPMPIVSPSSMTVSFDAVMDGGTGADGLALAFADVNAGAKSTSLGSSGGGLGWSGIPGFAVALDTYANGTDPSSNFVGLATGFNPTSVKDLTWKATSSTTPPLRAAHQVTAVIAGGTIYVSIDGTQLLTGTVSLPGKVLIGFTSADGNRVDRHAVSNVRVTAS